jgi:hypothetical protein
MVKSSTDSPSLNQMLSNSILSCCALTLRTTSLPIHKDLTASHAYAAAALVMTYNAIRSSCSVTSPGSMASQRFLACSLIFMISAHSV